MIELSLKYKNRRVTVHIKKNYTKEYLHNYLDELLDIVGAFERECNCGDKDKCGTTFQLIK